jgi:predicted acetyltransferase
VLPPVYDAARRQRGGMVTRPDFWWPEVYHYMADQVAPSFRVVHEDGNGYVDGFALYGVRGDWQNGLAGKRLVVMDLVSTTPSAHEALWQFLIGVDLVDTIVAVNLPIDEPLRFMLTDPRRVRTDYVNDGLWLCMLDEVAALSARSYAVDGSLAFEVHRPDGSVGRFLLDAGRDGAACTPANASADLVLGTSELSASYLGGVSFASLRDAGRVEEVSAGAIARADALFATPVAPAMTTNF